MLKIYGSMQCPDCVACRNDLDRAGVEYEYLDFADDLRNLKAFLAIILSLWSGYLLLSRASKIRSALVTASSI